MAKYLSVTVRGGRYGKWGTSFDYKNMTEGEARAAALNQLIKMPPAREGDTEYVIEKVEEITTYPMPFYIGDGSDKIFLDVTSYSEYPRGYNGCCAFCEGDPCAEHSPEDSRIAQYFSRNTDWNEGTCPLCQGRPT